MNDIKITPTDIKNFARNISAWSSQFGAIESSMRSKAYSLNNTWKDARFHQFVEVLSASGRQMKALQEQFVKLSADLNKMADRLEDEIKQQHRMINKYR